MITPSKLSWLKGRKMALLGTMSWEATPEMGWLKGMKVALLGTMSWEATPEIGWLKGMNALRSRNGDFMSKLIFPMCIYNIYNVDFHR